jgi:phosphoribosyl-AMP cyclohydrolase / phosphoribosyl-ATP pyrophosphohydrolase
MTTGSLSDLSRLVYDASGLVPVVAQDRVTGEIRMLAYANATAVARTRERGFATFFSRSRQALWEKGETSGNRMAVSEILVDCDADALVYLVDPAGPTCHTGARSCFPGALSATTLTRLEATLEARKSSTAEASYVKSLYERGGAVIGEKVEEEAGELARAVAGESDERVVSEAADVVFHVLVALRARGVSLEAVLRELDRRAGTSGHDEKRARAPKT